MSLPRSITDNLDDAYYIINRDDKCVHLHAAQDANGASLTLWDRVDAPNVQWRIRPTEEPGYYNVVSVATSRAIHNHGASRANGAPCTTWEVVAADNLKIRFDEAGSHHPGYYYLVFKDSGKCVHNSGDLTTNGNPITQWDKIDQKNVMWRLERVGGEEKPDVAAAKPDVVVAHVQYKGEVKRVQSDEYVEITNRGTGAADISGWSLDADDARQSFKFPAGTSLAPGQSVRVYTNQVHSDSGGFTFGIKRAIWNDAGDVARLSDAAGNLVSSLGYGAKA
jgi:hypothetical protein